MNIPWLTPIIGAISDGKLAALLEKQVIHLTRERDDALVQLGDAQAKIKVLESQVKKLTPQDGIDAEAAQVLSHLSKGGGELTCYQIADTSGIGLERVKRHLGYLRKLKFAQWARARVDDFDPPHRITDAGSDFLYQSGMV